MKVVPLNDKIVVKRVEAEEKTAGGIVLPDTAKEKPWDEALLPGLLTVPLVGLSALGATRIVSAWQQPEE